MEHSFRIAIWMFLLLGFLQARPTFDGLISDFGLTLLRDKVSCSENVTFASPSNMTGDCPGNSLTVITDGLKRAEKDCKDTDFRVEDALSALNLIKNLDYPMETSSQVNCTSQEAGNWTQFLTGCETLFQRLRSNQ